MKQISPIFAFALLFSGCSKRVDGSYTFADEGTTITVDLRSDGAAIQQMSFIVLPGENPNRIRMGEDALTILNGSWTLSGSRLTVSGKSKLGVDQSNDYTVEPNGDLIETSGNRYRLTKRK